MSDQLSSNWIERPYGRKKVLSDDGKTIDQIVVIEPGRNTGKGASPELMDEYGLVGHPGILYEHIDHEGFEEWEIAPEPSLKFVSRSLDKSTKPNEFLFSKGSSFYSVGMDEKKLGYYHTLENISQRPIRLRIRAEKITS
jgi:hypothetical protein